MKNGSNVLRRGYKGETALHAAARRDFVEIALLILGFSTDCFVLDTQDHYRRTVLHEAALHGNETLVLKLLKSGGGLGQLLVPVVSEDVEAVHQKFECTSSEGITSIGLILRLWIRAPKIPLHYACAGGNASAVALFLQQVAQINPRDGYGNTPVRVALN